MRIIACDQLSPEWWAARCGIPTASEFGRIITPKKMQYAAAAEDYINELIADRICQCPPYFTEKARPINSYAVRNGTDTEPHARRWFESQCEYEVRQVGFCTTDDGRFGASPDCLLYENGEPVGFGEIKVPTPKVHVGYLRAGVVPAEYLPQTHGALVVGEGQLRFGKFISYCEGYETLVVHLEPGRFTDRLKECLATFDAHYQEALKFFRREPLAQTLEAAIAEQRSRQ